MGTKRKAEHRIGQRSATLDKKVKLTRAHEEKPRLVLQPRPDWHSIELPALPVHDAKTLPPKRTLDEIQKYATSLLHTENAVYNQSHLSGSSSHKFLSTIMSSGTLEDKISALTLLVQESPLHTMKAMENLLGLARKKSRNHALMALSALKDLLGQGMLLPDRKLRAFNKQPVILSIFQGNRAKWTAEDALPLGLEKCHLLLWAYEDWLKKTYFELLVVLESWCNDEVAYVRSRAITFVWELLKSKPEQEENLLRLLVNKLGDTDRKIASRASFLLLQLENAHPAMKLVITNSIEKDCLCRPGQSLHAKYYAVITLNQTILSQKEEQLANLLLSIYFSLFVQLLKPAEKAAPQSKTDANGKSQGGGGKAGKRAAKKRKADERSEEAEVQLRDKMMAQLLTGVNRAFPFADTNDPTFEHHVNTIFRVAHSSNFNTSVQALVLVQQISSTKHYGAERFYRSLYESILDPRLTTSSKQVMYLNLLYKSMKADFNPKRVQAFMKRLLQACTMHEPPFICGVLYMISELQAAFPIIRNLIEDTFVDEEDEEEHFMDVLEPGVDDEEVTPPDILKGSTTQRIRYDARKRDPAHARAECSCLWDLLPYLNHFHPSVALFAESLLSGKVKLEQPDPSKHTLMHFLDRFVYRNAKSKESASNGISIMQPMAGSQAADMLIKPGESLARHAIPVNNESFWKKKVEDVAADEVFFHSYFNQAGAKSRKSAKKDVSMIEVDHDEGSEDEGEGEIWEAISRSRPEIDGPDENDDLSLGDLESAYEGSEDGSEPGIDLGGDGNDDQGNTKDRFGDNKEPDALDLESDDDAMFGDDDDIAMESAEAREVSTENEPKWKQKRKEKKKLKQLPTFASAEDYARLLLDDEPDYA